MKGNFDVDQKVTITLNLISLRTYPFTKKCWDLFFLFYFPALILLKVSCVMPR